MNGDDSELLKSMAIRSHMELISPLTVTLGASTIPPSYDIILIAMSPAKPRGVGCAGLCR